MGLIDRDYMHEERSGDPRYSPRSFRRAPTNASFWSRVWRNALLSPATMIIKVVVLASVAIVLARSVWPSLLRGVPPAYPTQAPVARLRGLVEAFPTPGSARYYEPVDPQSLVSNVKINVQAGSDHFKQVLRIISVSTQQPFVDIYLVQGQQVEIGLPAGDFVAQVFVGDAWLGQDQLFGTGRGPSTVPDVIHSQPGGRSSIGLGTPISL